HFPTITDYCKNVGIDIRKDLIPIVPVAHYQCGGIQVDKDAQTTVKNLFAVGECSCTGLHGKNRLASNSLLEALVFAHQSSEYICKHIDEMTVPQELVVELYPITEEESTFVQELKNELKTSMTSHLIRGVDEEIIKNKSQEFKKQDQILSASSMSLGVKELQNMIDVAILIAEDKQ